jgi:hypothetical protein
MNSTWYNVAVVLLWLACMGWLISQKVVPALILGEPPSYRTVIEAQRDDPLVGWSMSWNDRPIGWALTRTTALPNGLTEVDSKVRFEKLPLDEMLPVWLKGLIASGEDLPNGLEVEANSHVIFDPLQRMSQFESSVGLPGTDSIFKIRGTIDGQDLHLIIRTGDFSYESDVKLPETALLNDSLSPQTKLPGLREGQSWSIRSYSPLRPRTDPFEILRATVESRAATLWGGRTVDAWLVVYRRDSGSGSGSQSPRGRLWVLDDGTIIRQEAALFDATMSFVRLPSGEVDVLLESVGEWK